MSGRKNQLPAYESLVDGDMSGDLVSAPSSISFLDNVGVQINFTGSPTGTFSVEVSADYERDTEGNVTDAGNWIPVMVSYWDGTGVTTAVTVPASVGSPIYLDLNQLSAPWVRITYASTSDAGTCSVFVTAKAV